MSVTFKYEIITPENGTRLGAGTSSDIDPLKRTFGDRAAPKDIPTLRAMHAATHQSVSLWSEIADALERLDNDGSHLRIWTEF